MAFRQVYLDVKADLEGEFGIFATADAFSKLDDPGASKAAAKLRDIATRLFGALGLAADIVDGPVVTGTFIQVADAFQGIVNELRATRDSIAPGSKGSDIARGALFHLSNQAEAGGNLIRSFTFARESFLGADLGQSIIDKGSILKKSLNNALENVAGEVKGLALMGLKAVVRGSGLTTRAKIILGVTGVLAVGGIGWLLLRRRA